MEWKIDFNKLKMALGEEVDGKSGNILSPGQVRRMLLGFFKYRVELPRSLL